MMIGLGSRGYSLNSLKRVIWWLYRGLYRGSIIGVVRDTRSLDYSSYRSNTPMFRNFGSLFSTETPNTGNPEYRISLR